MMIKASAIHGRLVADSPSDPAKFEASRAVFEKLSPEIRSHLRLLDGKRLDFITHALGLSFSSSIPSSMDIDILDIKTTRPLRKLFESAAILEKASGEAILKLCKQYNDQIEDLARSKGYTFARVTSDFFTKHVLAISLGVTGGLVGGPLPGLAGLIIGEVAQQLAKGAEQNLGKPMKSAAKSMTRTLAKLLGKDSNLVHLCLAREALKKR